jgi:hypothetical protein
MLVAVTEEENVAAPLENKVAFPPKEILPLNVARLEKVEVLVFVNPTIATPAEKVAAPVEAMVSLAVASVPKTKDAPTPVLGCKYKVPAAYPNPLLVEPIIDFTEDDGRAVLMTGIILTPSEAPVPPTVKEVELTRIPTITSST